jgi:hypothetical protein
MNKKKKSIPKRMIMTPKKSLFIKKTTQYVWKSGGDNRAFFDVKEKKID